MTTTADMLLPTALPQFDALTPDAILPALDRAIADQDETVAKLVREAPTTFEAAWMPLERVGNAVDALWSAVSHLHGVADTPELRA
ncbi:hypothetical protein ACTGY9_12635, partial [Streptococcus suis]